MTRTPVVNYALVAINVLIFVMKFKGNNPAIRPFILDPQMPELAQFFSSMFLHANFMHLAGNMVFLWVFGNALNDRMGNIGYLLFYLSGGLWAGVGYVMISGNAPVLGASGAISAVTGAYLVLFPRVRVTLLLWFYIITTFEVSSLLFLAFQFFQNLFMSLPTLKDAGGGVAYVAHTSGYVFGIAIAAGLLAVRLLPRDSFDLLNLIRTRHRRQKFRRMANQGYDPFSTMGATGKPGSKRWVESRSVEQVTPDSPEARAFELRREIADHCRSHDLATAASKYLQLVQMQEDVVLSQQYQLDVANQLMSSEHHAAAADAYERFLKHYEKYPHIADIYLMLGVLYGRYLQQYDRAEELLQKAISQLDDNRKIDLARGDLAEVRRKKT